MLKIVSIHTDRVDARQLICIHRISDISLSYWTSANNNKWPKCPCRYRTHHQTTPDVIDNDVTDNDVIDSWMNMHTSLASRPNVVASTRREPTRRDALGVNGALGTAENQWLPELYMLWATRVQFQLERASVALEKFHFRLRMGMSGYHWGGVLGYVRYRLHEYTD